MLSRPKAGTNWSAANVPPVMAVNLDPKPGRWILPLVILGMIAFTYFFVRELPEASPNTTLAGATTTTTIDFTTTTVDNGAHDPAVQAYLDAIDEMNAQLKLLETEMISVNDGFDSDPRTIEYSATETRIEKVATDTTALSSQFDALTAPEGLEINHDLLTTAIHLAVVGADDALTGLRSTDTGEIRRSAVEAYALAVADFNTEVTNAHNAADDL